MLMSLLAAMALVAPNATTDPCRDDKGKDRCLPAQQEKMRTLYRVAPIAAYAAGTSRRLFYVDGYGRDVIAIEYMRMPGQDPLLRVHFPTDTRRTSTPLQTSLTTQQWTSVIDASENFDRKYASRPPAKTAEGDEAINVCIHSWVYWAEATDPGKKSRSVTDDACNDSPVEQFAWVAAKVARASFPHCAILDPQHGRNEATLLKDCQNLSGDRIAAAEVWNRAKAFWSIDSADRDGGIDGLSDYKMSLEINGSVTRGKFANEMWRSLFTDRTKRPNFYYGSIKGIDATTVVVTGELHLAGDDDKSQVADVEMRWTKAGNSFSIAAITIGPYKPSA